MAEEIKRIRFSRSDEIYRDDRNPRHPVRKGTFTICHLYVVGTDFTSGNNLRLDLDVAQTVLFAIAKTPSNAFKTIVETDLATELGVTDGSRQGRSLTFRTSTTDIQVYIVYTV